MNFSFPLQNSQDEFKLFTSKYLEERVHFSFKFTQIHKRYCLSKAKDNTDIESFLKTLWKKEDFTWRDFLYRNKKSWGLQIETRAKGSDFNYTLLKSVCPQFDNFWHFYIEGQNKSVWRIFWAFSDWKFYIVYIDINWEINSSAHK